MKLERTSTISFGWLCVVPLVDVLFLLIFFLLLSTNFILQPGIAITPPLSTFALAPQPDYEIISITGGAAPALYFRDQRVTLEQLGQMLEQTKASPRPVIIKADRTTSYEEVMRVSNAVLERGVPSVSLATAPAT